jgi:hypothetical protein
MLAMTNLAAADAAIGCWHEKYRWNSWRPEGAKLGETVARYERRHYFQPVRPPFSDEDGGATSPDDPDD